MTAADLARRMAARARAVEPEFRKTSHGIAIAAVKFTKERVDEEIYAVPEDVRPRSGKKKWQRTGKLRREEQAGLLDAYTVRVVNLAPYAVYRHEAGKPNRRRINPLRLSHWRDELLETFSPLLPSFYQLTIQKILGRKGA